LLTPSFTTELVATSSPCGNSTPTKPVFGLDGGYLALVARNSPLSPASSTVVEKKFTIGRIVHFAIVAGIAITPVTVSRNRKITPVLTKPGYLIFKLALTGERKSRNWNEGYFALSIYQKVQLLSKILQESKWNSRNTWQRKFEPNKSTYLWMNVIEGWDFANSSNASVVW
jgi:hypothetical protein